MKTKSSSSAYRARRSDRVVHFEKGSRHLTNHAGLIPVIRYLDTQLGFGQLLRDTVGHQRGANARYLLADGVFLVLTALIGGASNLSQCAMLWCDEVLQRVAGWAQVPDETTLGRLFKSVSLRHISELETLVHRCREKAWGQALKRGTSRIATQCEHWIDADSSVKTVYGKQEGAAKGYNPHKRGALSYHPLLAFSAHTKEILQGWLRSGDAYTSNGIVEFMRQLLAHFPKHIRIVLRADSGFYNGALLEFLESLGHGYLIKVKMRGLIDLLMRQHWSPVPGRPGWQQCEFRYRAKDWNEERFFVAVRREKPIEDQPQGDLLPREAYDFFCYVTSEPLSPWLAHRKYGERATSETWIEEGKSQMALAHIKTDQFLANSALFQAAILAYNTLRWMALISGNEQLRRWEPNSLRTFMIRIGGRLLTGSNQLRIQLPPNHLHPEPWRDWLAFA
jgi:hypothetical protein